MQVRERIKRLENSRFIGGKFIYQFSKQCWYGLKFLSDGQFRSEKLNNLLYKNKFHQRATFTAHNRYPLIFQTCAEHLASSLNPKILSVGCSTGEEVGSLGRYIPTATIIGVDINRWSLRQCRKKYKSPQFSFLHRFSTGFETQQDFDAIFCMAVFQRTENRTNKDNSRAQGFLFEHFEREVEYLDRKLKPGGLLIIDHADFSFTDTSIAINYSTLNFEKNRIERKRPLFNRNNQKVADSHSSFRVFVKYS